MHYTKAVARRCSIKKDALKNNMSFFFNKALDRRPAALYLCMYVCIYVCISNVLVLVHDFDDEF